MNKKINIRKATAADIANVSDIYKRIHDEEESGRVRIGWVRGIYPEKETAEAALQRGDLFVEEADGRTVGTAIINQIQVDVYGQAEWKYHAPAEQIMVLHTLVIDPGVKGKGYGTAFVNYYEQYALDHGCRYLRMDTNEINTRARAFYKASGYEEAGIRPCVFNGMSDVRLVMLEKRIDITNYIV